MKRFIVLVLVFVCTKSIAQPGFTERFQDMMLEYYSDTLLKDSANYELIWKRVDMLFNPHFDLYTLPIPVEDTTQNSFRNFEYEPHKFMQKYNIDLLGDLNKLIENKVIIKELGPQSSDSKPAPDISLADYYYKKGQYFYLKNRRSEALAAYLKALELQPYKYLKERICISIAAHYYTSDAIPMQDRLRIALAYIDSVCDPELENRPLVLTRYNSPQTDTYEREKIMLLEATGNITRLVNYYKNLSLTHLNYYLYLTEKESNRVDVYAYSVQQELTYALDYLNKLNTYYVKHKMLSVPDNEIQRLLHVLQNALSSSAD